MLNKRTDYEKRVDVLERKINSTRNRLNNWIIYSVFLFFGIVTALGFYLWQINAAQFASFCKLQQREYVVSVRVAREQSLAHLLLGRQGQSEGLSKRYVDAQLRLHNSFNQLAARRQVFIDKDCKHFD